MNLKKILIYLTVLTVGIVLGCVASFFITGEIGRQFVKYHSLNNSMYNVSNNTRILSFIRGSKIENALDKLENDLDMAIIELYSSLTRKDLSQDERNKIVNKLLYAKKYRSEYPHKINDVEIQKMVNDVFKEISN